MRNYFVNHDVTKNMCVGFYNSSALTLEGLSLESLPDYADYLDNACGLKDGATFDIIEGCKMNEYFDLTGETAYPDDLHIVVIHLCFLKDPNKIVLKRFEFGGRWFDDVIDNLTNDVVKALYE